MADLQKLSDQDLLTQTKTLAAREREILTDVLKHLREVRRRRLFSELKYKSMMDYAVRELGYTEDQAYHRLAAMELIRRVDDRLEIRLSVPKSLEAKIQKIKDWLSHAHPDLTTAELFEKLCDAYIERLERNITRKTEDIMSKRTEKKTAFTSELLTKATSTASPKTVPERAAACQKMSPKEQQKVSYAKLPKEPRTARAHISLKLRREVFAESGGTCQNCGGSRFLELDHRLPLGKGGTNDAANLRVLCRSCNARAAVQAYGQSKMDMFLQPR